MNVQQMLEALAQADPGLEPWQKCRHEFEATMPLCKRCGAEWPECFVIRKRLPSFGDGKTRYQTEGEIFQLCSRLRLFVTLTGQFDDGTYLFIVTGPPIEMGFPRRHGERGTIVEAGKQAILRAMGVWEE